MASTDTKPVLSQRELTELIHEAAAGDQDRVQRLIKPLLSSDERILWSGPIAKLGVITTHNFGFITNRRIGNLQVTPFSGTVHSTVCNLQHVDAYTLIQPALPFRLWMVIGLTYLLTGFVLSFVILRSWITFLQATGMYFWLGMTPFSLLRLGLWIAGPLLAHFVFRPAIIWLYLRFRKSGLWLKLRGGSGGVVLLADRHQFGSLLALSRALTEQKRIVDRELES